MQINGTGPVYRVDGPHSTSGAHRAAKPEGGARQADSVDISPAAQEAARLAEAAEARAAAKADGSIRADKVASLRQQIADGSYDTPERLDAAVDRLLDQIG